MSQQLRKARDVSEDVADKLFREGGLLDQLDAALYAPLPGHAGSSPEASCNEPLDVAPKRQAPSPFARKQEVKVLDSRPREKA